MIPKERKKLYCYVDETGQDAGSKIFVVVTVASLEDQKTIRQALLEIEDAAGTGHRKWHKSRPERRLRYIRNIVERNLCAGDIYFGIYKKPLPYFFPFIEVLEQAIKSKELACFEARIFVDGIDRQKARELTNALRLRGISLQAVMSRRDESEPLIRLADMWAGCIRAAYEGSVEEVRLIDQALEARRVWIVTEAIKKRKTP